MIIPPDPRPMTPTTPAISSDTGSDGLAFAAILDKDAAGDTQSGVAQPDAVAMAALAMVPGSAPMPVPPMQGETPSIPGMDASAVPAPDARDLAGDKRVPVRDVAVSPQVDGVADADALLTGPPPDLPTIGDVGAGLPDVSRPNGSEIKGVVDRSRLATGSVQAKPIDVAPIVTGGGKAADRRQAPPTVPAPVTWAPGGRLDMAPPAALAQGGDPGPAAAPLVAIAAVPALMAASGGPVAVQVTVFRSAMSPPDADPTTTEPATSGTTTRPDAAGPQIRATDIASGRAVTATSEGPADEILGLAEDGGDRRADGLAAPSLTSSPTPAPAATGARAVIDTVAAAIPPAAAAMGRVEVILSPEELGRVQMDFRADGDSMRVFLTAERPDTLDLLRRHADQLAAELRQAGYSGASLSFGQWGQSRPEEHRAGRAALGSQADGRGSVPAPAFSPPDLSGCGLDLRI